MGYLRLFLWWLLYPFAKVVSISAAGFMLFCLFVLPVAFMLCVLGYFISILAGAARLLFFFADFLHNLGLQKGDQKDTRIPIAAAVFYAVGEAIVFGSSSYMYFK
jgi:hypothetical protein